MYFQDIITTLNNFWESFGCLILQSYDIEKGAATLSPHSFFRLLDNKSSAIAYVDACRRPNDSRYGIFGTDRYQHYYQYQVLIKPEPSNPQKIFLDSLKTLGINIKEADLVFKDDFWESPVFGAKGKGWEVWLNGSEIAQLTYLDSVGGVPCQVTSLEITYGLERLALYVQKLDNFSSIAWNEKITYGNIYQQSEYEFSIYNLEVADTKIILKLLNIYIQSTEELSNNNLIYPAFDCLLKATHCLNILESRKNLNNYHAFLQKIRRLSTKIATLYISKNV
jgi:glycyl-tRNA synthetase alpha chain